MDGHAVAENAKEQPGQSCGAGNRGGAIQTQWKQQDLTTLEP